jgi:transposase
MTRQTRRYTKEFKEGAIGLALKSPSLVLTAKELGIPIGTLGTWISALNKKEKTTTTITSTETDVSRLLEENRRLHKELGVVREEREILKKAAAYFAQNQK